MPRYLGDLKVISSVLNSFVFSSWSFLLLTATKSAKQDNKNSKYYPNSTLLISMKYKEVQILYDKNGNITEKIGNNIVIVMILPNAQVLESYWNNST